MNESKNNILNNVRQALKDVPEEEKASNGFAPRNYRQQGNRSQEERVNLFINRISEYETSVKRVEKGELESMIAESCKDQNVNKLAASDDFPSKWIPKDVTPLIDDSESPLSHQDLAGADGIISTCALAIAQTGTIALNSGEGQGRRALTLLPDYYLCIIREDQIVELVPEGIDGLEESVKEEGRPVTFISGPSATSDIELNRVEGVHGPRRLEVLIVK